MFSDIPFQWIVWGIVMLIAFRSLISMSIQLRDRLQALLLAYVKQQRIESRKLQRIRELRERIKARKAVAVAEKSESKSKAA